ncbi:MAG TPA: beta-L-arabinofuranosidase domain-containing protein, partial [Lentzea sp.]
MIASRRDFGVSAEAFPLGAVALLPGPFRDDASRAHARLLRLDPDRLLHTFRRNAGLPSEVVPCGGWEAPSSELRGHSTGHVLSALAQAHATSGDRAFSVRAEYFVEQLALCQDRARTAGYSTGYLSAFPEGFLGRVEACQPVLAPYATLHKIMAGLLDVHVHVGSRQALTVLSRMAAWAGWRLGRLSPRQRQDVLATESGGMNEVLANLYQLTGDPAHLLTARHFDHAEVFDRLAKPPAGDRCTKELGGDAGDHHAKVLGAIRAYHATGTARYRDIAMTFWDLAAARTCRGWCDADGVLELARQLFRTDPGRTRYFDHAAKVLHDLPPVVPNPDDFTCCHGSGLEV